MESRVAVISIIVKNPDAVESINSILHKYGEYVIGRLGLPYRKRGVCIICVAVDAPANVISALSGKIGNIVDVSAKTAFTEVQA